MNNLEKYCWRPIEEASPYPEVFLVANTRGDDWEHEVAVSPKPESNYELRLHLGYTHCKKLDTPETDVVKQLLEENTAHTECITMLTETNNELAAENKKLREGENKPVQPEGRRCKNCRKSIKHKHPNAKFCRQKCKDKYHNKTNPRGYGLKVGGEDYADDPYEDAHPHSSEALGQW